MQPELINKMKSLNSMSNITLLPEKTKSNFMDQLKAIAAGEKPAAKRIPKGEYHVMSASFHIGGIHIGFCLLDEVKGKGYTSETNIQWLTLKLDDMIAFVKKNGGLQMGSDGEGNMVVQRYQPVNIKSYVYGHKDEVAERMLNAGEVNHG